MVGSPPPDNRLSRFPSLTRLFISVVQRQMWLMEHADLSRNAAYDQARKEFYALRQEEEMERRVAREEAGHVGAYFGKNRLEVSMDIENKEWESWKAWAAIQVQTKANVTTEITFDQPSAEDADLTAVEETAEQVAAAKEAAQRPGRL